MEKIKINFIKSSEDGVYSLSDALHLPANHTYTDEEIEAMKQQRFDNWLYMIMNPPEPVIQEEVPVEEPVIVEEPVVEEPPIVVEEEVPVEDPVVEETIPE